jgi:hypothetical protein
VGDSEESGEAAGEFLEWKSPPLGSSPNRSILDELLGELTARGKSRAASFAARSPCELGQAQDCQVRLSLGGFDSAYAGAG